MNAHNPHLPSGQPIVPDENTGDNVHVPQITVITKCDVPALMSKRISLGADGNLKSDGSECRMTAGTAARAFVGTASALALIITECRSDQAITLGALKAELPDTVAVTVPCKLTKHPGAITRSRSYIDYQGGVPAWCLIDFDSKGMPDEIQRRIDDAGGMWNALLRVAPELAKAARVSRASTTAGLFRSDTKEQIAGSNGMHHYVLVRDGGDIGRLLKDLHERCWLHGFGWHLISAAGHLLDRSIVDRMVGYGERLCFEGAPVIAAPLAQEQAKRAPQAIEGKPIDALAVPRLTEYERHSVSEAKAASAKVLGRSAAEVRSKHDKELAEKISVKSGAPLVTALRLVEARHRGVLFPDVELEFDHLGVVAVGALLADPDRYVGETLADPLEGGDYGRCKAKVMRGEDGDLLIHSFAHGRGIYFPRHDLRSAKEAFAQGPNSGTVDHAITILALAEIEEDELDAFAMLVSKTAGVGLRAVKTRFKKARAVRETQARTASMEVRADGRIIRPRPERDGELLPIVMFLDDVLAKDPSEEPPMRNASRAIARVEEKEPWGALHLLTSDSANAATEGAESIKAPAEPVIVELTETGVELLIEQRVCWTCSKGDGSIYFGATPRPFLVALMEYPSSSIPIVRAINTSPLVTASGRVVDGAGLDRSTGLVHRIDPALRACVPVGTPTDEEISRALSFLLDEWLVDVALDRVGKCVAVMLALTVLQRALLPERPAFFVTAGQRGGGKTTLIIMIITAVLGRRPAAAAWSSNVEERKKALFSYLRQGVAALVWDNVARGSTISCPHIEAALTATEISDRVLGVSSVETVPATTVQVFTGNSIAPRGDMASRSFTIPLDVDRPDPENRDFKHADPLAWTEANRARILRSLYTILISGALRRPQGQVAKTRFKVWWALIGWPAEYAARLLDIKLDCTQLLRLGESEEEEASATSRALAVLGRQWDGNWFTTRDVVLFLDERNSRLNEDKAVRAEALFDALSDLIGKPLENPTARSVGKLFQKHLTNRPAFLEGENCSAVLRKLAPDKNRDGNKYEIVMLRLESSSGD